jgi:hypothetical protein
MTMKILHITLNEYNSLEELHQAFWDMPSEMKKTGVQLASTKKDAEAKLKYQKENFPTTGARIFWWSKEVLNDVNTFVMHGCIFD